MQSRTLLILLVVVLALGTFVWLYERQLPSSDERAELAERVLDLDAEEVVRVTLEWDDNRVVLVRRATSTAAAERDDKQAPERSDWSLVEPVAARADRWAVEGLVDELVELEHQRTLEAADPRKVGLEPPRGTVTLASGEGEVRLEIGSQVPASGNMLVRVVGRPAVYVVSDAVWEDLSKQPGEWRDKDVFLGEREKIDRLILSGGAERVILARRGDRFWLESPILDRADRSLVNSLLSEVVGLRVHTFLDQVDRPPGELGLEPPQAVLEVVLEEEEEEPFWLELGYPSEEDGTRSYARTSELLFETTSNLRQPLTRAVVDWQAKSWSGLQTYNVDAVRVEDETGALELERAGGDWLRAAKRIPFAPVSDLLYAVEDAAAERFLEPAEMEQLGEWLVSPTLTLTYTDASDDQEVLTLYAPLADGVPARSSGRDVVLLLPLEAVQEIREKLAGVRAAEVTEEEDGL
jgi:hypothetical protein